MSNASLLQVYVDGFRDNVRQISQQKGTKLRMCTDQFSPEAETGNWDRLGPGEADAKTRKMATPDTGRVWSRRTAIATPYNDAEYTEQEDPHLMLQDPNNAIVQSLGFSMGRKMDDIIIAAALGNATNSVRASDGSNTPTQVALPAGQIVGDYSADISFDAITEINEIFDNNDVDESLTRYAVIGPRQVRQLMNLTEQTSSDYVQAQSLQNRGIVENWMGFTWIKSTRLLHPTTAQTSCLFMTQGAVGFHIPQDIITKLSEDPSTSYVWIPYAQFTAGAVRIEDEQVVMGQFKDDSIA